MTENCLLGRKASAQTKIPFPAIQENCRLLGYLRIFFGIVSEYDQEIPQSQTADNSVAPRGRAAQPSRDTRKTN